MEEGSGLVCCGRVVEISGQDDRIPVYLCTECGRQGPASDFAPPRVRMRECGRLDGLRFRIAEFLYRLASVIEPE